MALTDAQQAELRSRARGDAACAQALIDRDLDELARVLSIGRTRASALEIGNGTILEVLGIEAGNRLLDHIQAADELRYVKPLLDQGRLKIAAPTVLTALAGFGADVLTKEDADKLSALGREPDPVSPQDVAEALYNPDGTQK